MNSGFEEHEGIAGSLRRVRTQRLITESVLKRLDERSRDLRRLRLWASYVCLCLVVVTLSLASYLAYDYVKEGTVLPERLETLITATTAIMTLISTLATWEAMVSYKRVEEVSASIEENRLALELLANVAEEQSDSSAS